MCSSPLLPKGAAMSNILHCLQLGETMRDRFLEQARALPYGSALFVVPNRYFCRKSGKPAPSGR